MMSQATQTRHQALTEVNSRQNMKQHCHEALDSSGSLSITSIMLQFTHNIPDGVRFRPNAIHVACLPAFADKEAVYQYFRGFGRISAVEMSYRGKLQNQAHSRYCLIITKDHATYTSILTFRDHKLRGKRIICTPCVKGTRSLNLVKELMSQRKVILHLQPDEETFESVWPPLAEVVGVMSQHGEIMDAFWIKTQPGGKIKDVCLTFENFNVALKLSKLSPISALIGNRRVSFTVETLHQQNQPQKSQFENDTMQSASSEGEELENKGDQPKQGLPEKLHSMIRGGIGRIPSVFPIYHKFVPCTKSYYTKRPRFGGVVLEHVDPNLRFNQPSKSNDVVSCSRGSGSMLWLGSLTGLAHKATSDLSSHRTMTPGKECDALLAVPSSQDASHSGMC